MIKKNAPQEITRLILAAAICFSLASPVEGIPLPQQYDLNQLDGEWTYLKDLTEDRALEQMGPPMGSVFSFGIEADAVIVVRLTSCVRQALISIQESGESLN